MFIWISSQLTRDVLESSNVIFQMILNGWSKLLFAGCCWLLLFTHYFLWKIVIFTCSAHVRAVASSQSSPLRNTVFFVIESLWASFSSPKARGSRGNWSRLVMLTTPPPPKTNICKTEKQRCKFERLDRTSFKKNTRVLNRNYRKSQRTWY